LIVRADKLSIGGGTVTVPAPGAKPEAEAVTVADPIPTPVTCGCVAGVMAPAAMDTLAVTVTFEVSLLISVTVKPPAGAGVDRVTGNARVWPSSSVVVAGTLIAPPLGRTVTMAVALVMPVALAVINTGTPATVAAIPVTVTVAVVAPAAKVTLGGTVALVVSLETRLTAKPPTGACPFDRVRVRFPILPALIVKLAGTKLMPGGFTITIPLPDM
jgi:hypothetical protein